MNLKDYLHLYIGCNVKAEIDFYIGTCWVDCELIGIENKKAIVRKEGNFSKHLPNVLTFDLEKIKPILRPLNDISEKEKCELECTDIQETYLSSTIIDSKLGEWDIHPKRIIWLLSKHFDLFGLIDAGLAINKTKLNSSNSPERSVAENAEQRTEP